MLLKNKRFLNYITTFLIISTISSLGFLQGFIMKVQNDDQMTAYQKFKTIRPIYRFNWWYQSVMSIVLGLIFGLSAHMTNMRLKKYFPKFYQE